MARPRLIPVTIAVACLLLAVKVVEVTRGVESVLVQPALAQTPEKKADAKPDDKPSATEKKPDATTEKKTAEGAKEPAKKEETAKEDAKPEGKKGGKKEKKNPAVSEEPVTSIDRHYSASEVELLEHLSQRREELDRWERNVSAKEAVLDATEKRIDDKIQQIDAMKKEVTALLAKYNDQEDTKINSLVKIYENMKPKDAARIFDEVEMPILLLIIDKMADKKAAPVLAEMDPRKAKQVTVDLAEERRINSAKLTSPSPPPPTAK